VALFKKKLLKINQINFKTLSREKIVKGKEKNLEEALKRLGNVFDWWCLPPSLYFP